MKTIFTILFSILFLTSFGQIKRFLIQGQIVDQNDNPISDVYIVNLDNHDKDISQKNGVFSVWVSPGDSLVLSHISYFRKIVSVHTLLVNPKVEMVSENVDIPEIVVSPQQVSELDKAEQNLAFMQEYNPPIKFRMAEEESDPVSVIMTENNRLMRSEASSISLFRFSPSENVGKLFTLWKKDQSDEYFSTPKTREELEKKKNK
ncbi:hypothetical protein [Draconibacterium sediminis]|uniref:TonB-dependent receptor plug domain-containing protein n=1 Tax=Draconibacterium sediminis TaxID=1544798 RepID=A0A0D8JDM6_9BACT|nr:hypothetical protein [Draconibacterium sediminis]KJF45007.1 hypothetical protein LH29_06230 [Draconibacterium sediminis]